MYKILVLIICLIVSSLSLFATPKNKFEAANKMYSEGRFEEALVGYKQVLELGVESAELYYNMGNAAYKTFQYSYAILYYEKALRLSPGDEDISANLDLIRKYHVTDAIEVLPEIFINRWIRSFRRSLSSDNWAYVSIFCFISFLSGLGLYLFSVRTSLRKFGFFIAIFMFLISLLSYNFAMKQHDEITSHHEAIIFTPSVIIKSSPDASAKDLFNLHEGTKVTIKDSTSTYFEIKLADGNVGWLLKTDVRRI